MKQKTYKVWISDCFDMIPGDLFGSPDEFFSFVFVLNGSGRTKRQELRDKGRGVRGEEVLRFFFAGLGGKGNADYADYADYAELEICLDCSTQNLDVFGAEDFAWKGLVDEEKGIREKEMLRGLSARLGKVLGGVLC